MTTPESPDPLAHLESGIEAISLLDDPVRRRIYSFVLSAAGYVDRDTVATSTGISRNLAAFHLDKLADQNLLQIAYRRVNARRGRGAGRPRKLYRMSDQDLAVSLPQRDYELMARLFATALGSGGRRSQQSLASIAKDRGVELGRATLADAGPNPSPRQLGQAAFQCLATHGFIPHAQGADFIFQNCPFRSLSRDFPDLVCNANLARITGFLELLASTGLSAVREPREPADVRCCVILRPSPE